MVGAGRWPNNQLNAFQSTPEFNILTDIPASQNVFSNWPVAITLVGVEMGDFSPAAPLPAGSPYAQVSGPPSGNIFQYCWSLATDLTNGRRGSWDSLPLIYLMGGVGTVFDYGGINGTVTIDGSGNNLWSAVPGRVSYLRLKATATQLANIVIALFSQA